MKKNRNSEKLFNEALNFIPGGVNSPVRSFKAVSGNPRYIKKAYGAYIEDEDDNKYIDYISSFGPLILGHANIEIKNAAKNALEYGTTYGACHKGEIEIARIIVDINIPRAGKILFFLINIKNGKRFDKTHKLITCV